MGIVEVSGTSGRLSFRERWATYFTAIIAFVALALGLNMRQSILTATVTYTDSSVGISARYPEGWLLDTSGDYVFRVRDMTTTGFKTTIEVNVLPISPDTTARNIADRLSLTRGQTLIDYRVLSPAEPYDLREDTDAQSVSYTFISRETSPFLEGVSQVVLGQDILLIARGQAIIITFRASVDAYEREYPRFERFLRSLDF